MKKRQFKNIETWNGFAHKTNELRSQTYSDIMDYTKDYVWKSTDEEEYDVDTQRLSRLNKLARERFESEFYQEFPLGSQIMNGNKIYEFKGLKFKTSFTNYDLIFAPKDDDIDDEPLIIQFDPENGYYLGYNIDDQLDRDSISLIMDMFWYKIRSKNRNKEEFGND